MSGVPGAEWLDAADLRGLFTFSGSVAHTGKVVATNSTRPVSIRDNRKYNPTSCNRYTCTRWCVR